MSGCVWPKTTYRLLLFPFYVLQDWFRMMFHNDRLLCHILPFFCSGIWSRWGFKRNPSDTIKHSLHAFFLSWWDTKTLKLLWLLFHYRDINCIPVADKCPAAPESCHFKWAGQYTAWTSLLNAHSRSPLLKKIRANLYTDSWLFHINVWKGLFPFLGRRVRTMMMGLETICITHLESIGVFIKKTIFEFIGYKFPQAETLVTSNNIRLLWRSWSLLKSSLSFVIYAKHPPKNYINAVFCCLMLVPIWQHSSH